jgi:aspartyl protease family protein
LKKLIGVLGVFCIFAFVSLSFKEVNAQGVPIYKCGKEYTNNEQSAIKDSSCKLILDKYGNAPAGITASGEYRIPRGKDGHFRVSGTVNGVAIQFLVDTGASAVTVSKDFARRANLSGGKSIGVQTANGTVIAKLINNVPVTVGTFKASGVNVVVGLVGGGDESGLLGESFLSQLDVRMGKDELFLARRKAK